MNETMKELADNETAMKALEQQANDHERLARECRDKRQTLKQRNSELRSIINDAKAATFLETTAQSAVKAQQEAESAKTAVRATLDSLKAKEAQVDELLKKLTAAPAN